jgi:hypothetical protein|nr:MAG TPA: hypothetical protein [Caudoviricetes sp.]
MKEIKIAGKLECDFNTQLKRHMDNVGNKLNDLVDAIKLAKKDGYNIKVDISKLEKEEMKREVANLKEKANGIRQDTLIVKINTRSTLSKLNEMVEKADEIRKEHNCNCTLFIKII